MALPTVTSHTPTRGHTGGMVFIAFIGTGFALPADPDTTSLPVPAPGASMSITFGGVEALDIRVEDDETVTCLAPICPLVNSDGIPIPGKVDIVLTNLDADGDPVAGESVTITDGFEYLRPNLSAKSFPHWVLETFMRQIILQVVPRVGLAVHTDFRDGEEIDYDKIPEAPCLVLTDVDFVTSTTQQRQGAQEIQLANGRFVKRRAPSVFDCELSIAGIATTPTEIMTLLTATELFFRKNTKLAVSRSIDKADPTAGTLLLILEYGPLQSMRITAGGSDSNIRTFAKTVSIRGIPFEEIPGLPNEGTALTPEEIAAEANLGIGYTVDEVGLTFSKKTLPDPE